MKGLACGISYIFQWIRFTLNYCWLINEYLKFPVWTIVIIKVVKQARSLTWKYKSWSHVKIIFLLRIYLTLILDIWTFIYLLVVNCTWFVLLIHSSLCISFTHLLEVRVSHTCFLSSNSLICDLNPYLSINIISLAIWDITKGTDLEIRFSRWIRLLSMCSLLVITNYFNPLKFLFSLSVTRLQ